MAAGKNLKPQRNLSPRRNLAFPRNRLPFGNQKRRSKLNRF